MAKDISEEFQYDLGNPAAYKYHTNVDITYDVAIDGMPFVMKADDNYPYIRQTAEYKKQQFDNTNEAGEQSLTGWWLRSQSSFHYGSGITFYEPSQDEKLRYRFANSQGVDPWTIGELKLLPDVNQGHIVTSTSRTHMRPINYGSSQDAVLLHDGYDLDKILPDGSVVHYVNFNAGTSSPIKFVCDDGEYAYFTSSDISVSPVKTYTYRKPLSGDETTGNAAGSASTGDVTVMFNTNDVIDSGVMNWVKGRIIAAVKYANGGDSKVFELTRNTSVLPSPIFTAPKGTTFTAVTASASDIYVSAYIGDSSMIYRLPLDSSGAFTTLSAGVVVAEMPRGEVVHSIEAYLGYMAIGTSRGVRIAQLLDGGGLVYGPLLFETSQPVYQFAVNKTYVWAACGVNGDAGLVRIDLSQQLDTLRFAYANDLQAVDSSRITGGVAFMNGSDLLAFSALHNSTDGNVYVQDVSRKRLSGFLTTGRIRFNTIEDKFFKYIRERATYPGGTLIISTIDRDGNEQSIFENDVSVNNRDIGVRPPDAQEFMSFKFTLVRDTTDTSLAPVMYGYQVKALPAAAKQRLIQYHLLCYDKDTDRLNNSTGYEGRAYARVLSLEETESAADVVNVQDLRTGEAYSAQIEQMSFKSVSSPDKRFSGFGGIITILVRKL